MNLPDLPTGLDVVARPFGDEWGAISDVYHASARADGWEVARSPKEIEVSWTLRDNFEPRSDTVLVWAGAKPVAYASNRWMDIVDKGRAYRHMCSVDPSWRGKGIGHALLHWAQDELRAKAEMHGVEPAHFQTISPGGATAASALLTRHGYRPTEHFAEMVRPDLDDIPDLSLPDGVEVRPVEEDHLRPIFDAEYEAFRDHWGFVEPTETSWDAFFAEPHRDQSMWKVAWAGDTVVGMVRNFINPAENREFDRLRGWTEDISTHRDWRGRGIAAGLIAMSLRELRDRGMTEAALGVHTDNPNGAFGLYEKMGYVLTSLDAVWEADLYAWRGRALVTPG